MPDRKNRNRRNLVDALHNANVLPDGNLMDINPIDSIALKIAAEETEEDPANYEEGI
jgi:hypothetical protein